MHCCFSDGGLTFSQMDAGIAKRGHLCTDPTHLSIYQFIFSFSLKALARKFTAWPGVLISLSHHLAIRTS